jgi:osmotically-inducible protein OsmY
VVDLLPRLDGCTDGGVVIDDPLFILSGGLGLTLTRATMRELATPSTGIVRTEKTMATATKQRTDQDIQMDVLKEVKWDARVQPNEIGVVVQDGVVTLTGWVDSYTKKWSAERAALRVKGVKAVANDIEVRLPGSAEHTDSDIAAAAIRALEWDAFVPAENIQVTVNKGSWSGPASGPRQRSSSARSRTPWCVAPRRTPRRSPSM